MVVYGERFVLFSIFVSLYHRAFGESSFRVFKNMFYYTEIRVWTLLRNVTCLLIILARELIEIILHAGGNLCTWRSRHHDKWPPKSIRSSFQAREYFFLDTSLLPRVYLSSSLVLIVFSITNVSNETDIPKQEPPRRLETWNRISSSGSD